MIEVSVTTEVDVPAEVAFAYLSDITRNPEWQDGVKSTKWTSSPAGQVGATYDQTLEYRNQVTTYRVTELAPGHSITVESVRKATIPTTVTRSVEPRGESACDVTVRIVGRPRGVRRFAKGALESMVRRSTEVDYTVLKRKLEGTS